MRRVLEIVAGPDAGRVVVLGGGRHLLGRSSSCRVVLDDPAVESHHAMMTVTVDGTVHVDQLAGRHPVRIDGMPVGDAARVDPGAAIEIGDSLLAIGGDPGSAHQLPTPGAVVLGAGTVRLPIERCEVSHHHPVLADLARTEREVVGLVVDAGNPASAAARAGVVTSVVGQLGADPATAGWRVVTASEGAGADIDIDAHADADCHSGRVVVVTDRAAPLRAGGLVDQLVGRGAPVTVLLLVDAASPATRQCSAVLHLGARWRARWIEDATAPMEVVRLHARGARGLGTHLTATA